MVGGGIAGLAAAWQLRDRDVVVLEAATGWAGACARSRAGTCGSTSARTCSPAPTRPSDGLLDDAGVRAIPIPGRLAALAMHDRIVSGAVEAYPLRLPIGLRSRVALAAKRAAAAARRCAGTPPSPRARPGEDPAQRQLRMLEFMADRSFTDFIGSLPDDVAAIYRATLNRSSGEPEELAAGLRRRLLPPGVGPLGRAVAGHRRRSRRA